MPDPAQYLTWRGKNGERRWACLVPDCGRSRASETPIEFICAKHWRHTDRWRRAILFRRARRLRKFHIDPDTDRGCYRLWRWLIRQAITRARGSALDPPEGDGP